MRKKLVLSLVVVGLLGGCARVSESRFNPLNWFGSGSAGAAAPLAYVRPAETRPLVAQVEALEVAPTPGGAIVKATGLPPVQGHWDAELVADRDAPEGVMAFRFHLRPPLQPRRVSTPASRRIVAATHLTLRELEGIGAITVIGAGNALSAAR